MTSSSLALRLLVVTLEAGAPALAGRPSDRAITFALAGDAIANRRPSVHDAPGFDTLIERIRGTDAAFANFETLIHDFDLPGDFFAARTGGGTRGFPADPLIWESVVAEVEFDAERELRSVRLHPIVLGFQQPRTRRGRPSPASEPQAKAILERLDALSQPFGSRVTYQDGIGVLTWAAAGESTASRGGCCLSLA